MSYRNRYGFPKSPVVGRYEMEGATLLDSESHGAITFGIDPWPGTAPPEIYRQLSRRYWSDP